MTAPKLLESAEQAELYLRGRDALLASWEAYARGAAGAAVHRFPGVAAAVFPAGPERAVYNNALLERGLGANERSGALDAMEAVYAAAGVARFPAWVHDRGCRTASLQSTQMAERVYAAVGFRDLGRILEYVPQGER